MKCPECIKEGKTSNIYPGYGTVTAMAHQPWYDEDGKYHVHDPNYITSYFNCSNGHEWNESKQAPCPTCGENWDI